MAGSGSRRTHFDRHADRVVKRAARAEHRWPALLALILALTLYLLLPNSILPSPLRFAIVGVGLALVLPMLAPIPFN